MISLLEASCSWARPSGQSQKTNQGIRKALISTHLSWRHFVRVGKRSLPRSTEQSRNLRPWHAASPRRCHKTETWDCWREVQHRWQSVGPSNFSSVQLTRKSTAPRSALLVRQQFCEVPGKRSASSNSLLCSRGRRLCCDVHASGLPSPLSPLCLSGVGHNLYVNSRDVLLKLAWFILKLKIT